MLRDANKSVRRSADSTFTSFAKKWPAQAQSAFDKLAPSDKKLISANL
ncbi:hypothetical protein MHBO_001465 [Bonamia ostreae]|uniref:CLASP N-terminal domain-containing protein n=1 Tax=Bonamia ostreae TaxID=126728 RepID=A0ABV2AJ30_9EUKA